MGLLADLVFLNTWKIRQQQCGRRAPCCLVSSLSQELNHYVAGDSVQPLGVWAYRVTRGRNHSEFQVSASCRSKRAFVQLFILWQHTPIGVCLASQWQCVHQIMPVCDTQTGELDWTIKKLLEDWYLRLISIGGDAEESEMEDAVCERVVQWSWSESLSKCCMHECLWQKHSPTFPSCTAADVTWAKRRAVKWQTEAVWIILELVSNPSLALEEITILNFLLPHVKCYCFLSFLLRCSVHISLQIKARTGVCLLLDSLKCNHPLFVHISKAIWILLAAAHVHMAHRLDCNSTGGSVSQMGHQHMTPVWISKVYLCSPSVRLWRLKKKEKEKRKSAQCFLCIPAVWLWIVTVFKLGWSSKKLHEVILLVNLLKMYKILTVLL